jgi:hypothetical protein
MEQLPGTTAGYTYERQYCKAYISLGDTEEAPTRRHVISTRQDLNASLKDCNIP